MTNYKKCSLRLIEISSLVILTTPLFSKPFARAVAATTAPTTTAPTTTTAHTVASTTKIINSLAISFNNRLAECKVSANPDSAPFHAGSGTSFDPYMICTEEEHNSIGGNPAFNATDIYYQLGSNLNYATKLYNPIGTTEVAFQGNYQGNNFLIRNVNLNATHRLNFMQSRIYTERVGIFGYTKGADISNLNIIDITQNDRKGQPAVGGLIGEATYRTDSQGNVIGTNISQVVLRGKFSSQDHYGALVGILDHSNISSSHAYFTMDLHFGDDAVGGLAGRATNSTIDGSTIHGIFNSAATEVLNSGTNGVGGLMGIAYIVSVNNSISNAQFCLGSLWNWDPPHGVGGVAGVVSSGSYFNNVGFIGSMKVRINSVLTPVIFDVDPTMGIGLMWGIQYAPDKDLSVWKSNTYSLMR